MRSGITHYQLANKTENMTDKIKFLSLNTTVNVYIKDVYMGVSLINLRFDSIK